MKKIKKDSLGDRMKYFENPGQRLMPLLPILIRLDGVAFHTFTRGLERPYDSRLSFVMADTARYLASITNAKVAYTQSDEISLLLYSDNYNEQVYFDAKKDKITSVLAARCSLYFNSLLATKIPEKATLMPVFDCRVWNVPTMQEAVNAFIWREKDAMRNAISMAAQSVYSHKELQNKNSSEMHEMLFQKGINFNDYPSSFKRGTYIQKRIAYKPFTGDEIERLPARHAARFNPDLKIERTEYRYLDLPPLTRIDNPIDVLFNGVEPIKKSEI